MQVSNNFYKTTPNTSNNRVIKAQQKQIAFGSSDMFLKQDSPEVTKVIEKVKSSYNSFINELNSQIDGIKSQAYKEAEEYKTKVSPALDRVRGRMKYLLESDKNPGAQKIMQAVDKFDEKVRFGYTFVPLEELEKCFMIVGKAPEVSKKYVDFIDFFLKMQYPGQDRGFNYDFEKITDNIPDNDEFQKKLYEYLEKSEENFKKTGRMTLIYVENMDRLINPELNSFGNIECMKNMMNKCDTHFHAELIFTTQDPSKLDDGAIGENRVGFEQTLDDSIKPEDFDEFKKIREVAEPYIEERKNIIQTCKDKMRPIQDKLEEATENCKKDIDEILRSVKDGNGIPKRFMKITEPSPEITTNALDDVIPNNIIKRILKSKVFIATAMVAFAGVCAYAYKKSKHKTSTLSQLNNASNTQIPMNKTNISIQVATNKALTLTRPKNATKPQPLITNVNTSPQAVINKTTQSNVFEIIKK